MNKRRILFVGFGLMVSGWIGNSIYKYSTYQKPPAVELHGIADQGSYKGVVPCSIKGNSGYKVSEVTVTIDGSRLDLKNVKKIGSKSFDKPFNIDTFAFTNGKHTLELEAVDASYHRNRIKHQMEFFVDNTPVKAAFLQPQYKVEQGHTIHVQIQSNKKLAKAQIKLLSDVHNCYPEAEHSNVYECFIPVGCEDQPNEYVLVAELEDAVQNRTTLENKVIINQFPFRKARGAGVPQEKLDSEREMSMSDKIREEALEKWTKDSPPKKLWSGTFITPVDVVRISTPFGEIRSNPDWGLYYHAAVDIVNAPRSLVWASQDGKVVMKDRYLRSGNTVVIDHGLGVLTMYYHLDSFANIEVGDMIKKGNPVGRVGMTGAATGYHVHWEMRVMNKAVDPMQWTQKTF